MNLTSLKSLLADHGCQKVYIKKLSPNDNSKNQVYLGGSFDILNILPLKDIVNEPAGDWKKERFKATLDFSWIDHEGNISPAPNSKLILYPKYPEVRFSGFLEGCDKAPSDLMTQRLADRILFLSVSNTGTVLGYVAAPDSVITLEFLAVETTDEYGVFKVMDLPHIENNKNRLLHELYRIHSLDWIDSKRLGKNSETLPCNSTNCGGYTLEAELNIIPNGYAEPDYLGWEIKQFDVINFSHIDSSTITLMTPEPTNGFYKTSGTIEFIRKYGYSDLKGKIDRLNFGGIHKAGFRHQRTNLQLELIGFDKETGKIRNTDGKIVLYDVGNNEAASWSFSSLILHWNRKHNQACYVPSQCIPTNGRKYRYSDKVQLGTRTDFQLFLIQMSLGNIYYDPGIKLENASTNPKVKKRSQFRIKSRNLSNLYQHNEFVNLTDYA